MKLEIKQNILLEHLNYVIKGISTKNLRPILNCIKFELTEEGLYLMSTDSEINKILINTQTIINTNIVLQIYRCKSQLDTPAFLITNLIILFTIILSFFLSFFLVDTIDAISILHLSISSKRYL